MGCFVVDARQGAWFAGTGPLRRSRPHSRTRARDRSEHPKRGVRHERPGTADGNLRLLPPYRACRIDLRTARRQRRQARRAAAQWRPHHHRDARPHPRLHGQQPDGHRRPPGRPSSNARAKAARPNASSRQWPNSSPRRPPRRDPQRNFRFFDNRQKYLLFVNTCSEKWVVAGRVGLELANIHPRPPALRLFDAGVGDGTVLVRVMRAMHDRYPHTPFYVVGKEISLEDVRLTLQKMSDRFFEHPATVLVLTNLAYADAPWLAVKSLSAASSMVWHEVPLAGNSAYRFEQQITDLEPFLAQNWKRRRIAEDRQPGLRTAGGAGALPRGPQVPARPDHPEAGRHHGQLRPGHRLAALPRARLARVQGQARDRAARQGARTGRAADRHPFARARSRHGDHPEGLAGRQSVRARPPPDHEGW